MPSQGHMFHMALNQRLTWYEIITACIRHRVLYSHWFSVNFFWFILGYLLKHGTTWKYLKRPTTNKKRPETTYNDLKRTTTTRNDLKRTTTSKTRPTTTWTYQQRAKKDAKPPTTSRFWDYFTIWRNWFSSLTRFSSNTWLQSFEHCFMDNHGEINRAPNICILSSVFITRYNIYRIRFAQLWHT